MWAHSVGPVRVRAIVIVTMNVLCRGNAPGSTTQMRMTTRLVRATKADEAGAEVVDRASEEAEVEEAQEAVVEEEAQEAVVEEEAPEAVVEEEAPEAGAEQVAKEYIQAVKRTKEGTCVVQIATVCHLPI